MELIHLVITILTLRQPTGNETYYSWKKSLLSPIPQTSSRLLLGLGAVETSTGLSPMGSLEGRFRFISIGPPHALPSSASTEADMTHR